MELRNHLPRIFPGSLTILLLTILCAACSKKKTILESDPGFSKYIEAYTSGVISKKNTIRIQLASEVSTSHALNETIQQNLFSFSPSVAGKAYWTDERTIEFRPDKDLQPDELYQVDFQLAKVEKVPEHFEVFSFNVQVIKPSFEVVDKGLKAVSDSKDQMTFSGTVLTADVEENAAVEKLVKASYPASSVKLQWQHNEGSKMHDFTVSGIQRMAAAENLTIQWNGDPLHIDKKDKLEVAIPAKGDFKVLDVRAVQEAEEYVLVQFSDPVAYNQDLKGLISVSEQEDISYTITGSEVKIYVANKLDGNYKVSINTGIENQWGTRLAQNYSANIFFENRLPSVQIQGRGTILPNSTGKLLLPFEAINLQAVDVSVIKIYANNVAQFLQTNDLGGEDGLRQVAKPLVQATIRLDNDQTLNLHKKNRFLLDLDKYVKTEPGAIYRINIGFRPTYSLYTCTPVGSRKIKVIKDGLMVDSTVTVAPDEQETTDISEEEDDYYYAGNVQSPDEDDEFWNRYDTYYPYGYNWNQRDNPCSKSYYNKERFASRNILATNIGLTAKKGNENSLVVAVSNILSTAPMNDIDLEVLDYQRQIVATGKTDNSGFATLELKRKPYLLIAKNGEEKSYLKLDDGSALPLSRFDVSGAEVKNGIKGFIFGERGVWRPGDSMYLSCIIEDKDNKLPADHPVEMELYSPTGQLYKRVVQTNARDGFNVFRTSTDDAAPTGNWNCKVKVGGAVFEKKLKIETVMPNRLKIDLDFGADPALGKGVTTTGTLTAKWLFGATATNLKARIDAQLYKSKNQVCRFRCIYFRQSHRQF